MPAMIMKNAKSLAIQNIIDYQQYNFIAQATSKTNKIDTLVKTIYQRKDNGLRKIIFSQFHQEIDIIQNKLNLIGIDVYIYDGRTNIINRNLNHKALVFILQVQTACEGINLQNFNEIYFVAPIFNPAIEQQAIARCHRIGQNKPVYVFRLYMTYNITTQQLIEQQQQTKTEQQTKTIQQQPKTIEQHCIIIQNKKNIIAKSIYI
jgi:SNF2 family DNA or RNA helicase